MSARIAQLPEFEAGTSVSICAIEKSLSYYEKFDFVRTDQVWKDTDGREHPIAVMTLNPYLIRMARRYLELVRVPVPDLRGLPPENALSTAEAREAHLAEKAQPAGVYEH